MQFGMATGPPQFKRGMVIAHKDHGVPSNPEWQGSGGGSEGRKNDWPHMLNIISIIRDSWPISDSIFSEQLLGSVMFSSEEGEMWLIEDLKTS